MSELLEDIAVNAGIAIGGWVLGSFIEGATAFGRRSSPRKWGAAFAARLRRPLQRQKEFLSVGYLETAMVILDGNGRYAYDNDLLYAFCREAPPDCPDDIAARIAEKLADFERRAAESAATVWNGQGVGLKSMECLRSADERTLAGRFDFFPSSYVEFQATVRTIGSEDRSDPASIYQMHLVDQDPYEVIPYLARHVGVAGMVLTADGYLIAARRGKNTGVRPGEIDASFVEGIEPTADRRASAGPGGLDIAHAVMRACVEELGFLPSPDQVQILGYGVDFDFYQHNFLALVRSNLEYSRIADLRNGRAKDRWESTIEPIPFEVDKVLSFLKAERTWSTALTVYYWALVNEFGSYADVRAANIFSAKTKLNYRSAADAALAG